MSQPVDILDSQRHSRQQSDASAASSGRSSRSRNWLRRSRSLSSILGGSKGDRYSGSSQGSSALAQIFRPHPQPQSPQQPPIAASARSNQASGLGLPSIPGSANPSPTELHSPWQAGYSFPEPVNPAVQTSPQISVFEEEPVSPKQRGRRHSESSPEQKRSRIMSFFSKKKKETNSPPTAMKAEFPPPPNQATVRLSASQGSSAPQPSIHQQVQASQPPHSLGSSAPPNMQQQRAPLSTRPPVVNGSNNPASPRAGQSTSGAPSSSKPPSSVIYPWSQRPLHYLPASLVSSNNESRPQSPALSGGPSPAPFPRYGHSVNSINKGSSADLYIFGGLVKDVVRNDLYVLQCVPNAAGSPQVNSSAGPPGSINVGLVETKGEVPGPRVGHASVGVGNVLIVWGGDTKTDPNQMQDDGLYLLNLSEWTSTHSDKCSYRSRHA